MESDLCKEGQQNAGAVNYILAVVASDHDSELATTKIDMLS